MFGWIRDLTARERRTMIACFGGWSLDALDVQIFSFVIPSLLGLWHITTVRRDAGDDHAAVSAFGGWIAGALADRIGRVRVLQIAILWYALFTFCAASRRTSISCSCCGRCRAGFGGEWAAGAVLMGEVIRDQYRGRAVGLVQTGWAVGWAPRRCCSRCSSRSCRRRPRGGRCSGSGWRRRCWCSGSGGSSRSRTLGRAARTGRLGTYFRGVEAALLVHDVAGRDDGDRRAGQ